MKNMKLFYVFGDPFGSPDSKVGITSNPANRLGNYQNSYSRKSHIACFDIVYFGPTSAINNLEKAVKQKFDCEIERDGRGVSEWVSKPFAELVFEIDKLITGYKFKVTKVDDRFLPMTVDTLSDFLLSMSGGNSEFI